MTSIPIDDAFEVVTFSLVIPTCDRRESLRRLLESIGRMAIPYASQVEVIVVDNGSVDGTAALLAEEGIRPANISFTALTEQRKGKARALTEASAAQRVIICSFLMTTSSLPQIWLFDILMAIGEDCSMRCREVSCLGLISTAIPQIQRGSESIIFL